jgi:hypothetical protein
MKLKIRRKDRNNFCLFSLWSEAKKRAITRETEAIRFVSLRSETKFTLCLIVLFVRSENQETNLWVYVMCSQQWRRPIIFYCIRLQALSVTYVRTIRTNVLITLLLQNLKNLKIQIHIHVVYLEFVKSHPVVNLLADNTISAKENGTKQTHLNVCLIH